MNTLVDMISGMEVKEDDEDFLNAVDYMFKGLERRRPDEPIIQQFRFRAFAGILGRVFIVRNSVPVKITLFSNFGSTNGLMSFSVPHRALPYSASRRNFLAFLLLK